MFSLGFFLRVIKSQIVWWSVNYSQASFIRKLLFPVIISGLDVILDQLAGAGTVRPLYDVH